MKVSELLHGRGTRLHMIRMNETAEMAARLLRREDVGVLVVKDVVRTEGNTPVGLVSERDVLQAIVDHGAPALKMPVSRLMSKMVASCRPDDDLDQVFDSMNTLNVRHVPVWEDHGVIGVISLRDILPFRNSAATAPKDSARA